MLIRCPQCRYTVIYSTHIAYLGWGGSQNFYPSKGGGRKIPGPLDRGDHKTSPLNFAQFCSPPVNVASLIFKGSVYFV